MRSLRARYPHRVDIPLALSAALVALPFGLLLPTVSISKAGGLSESEFSVITGIIDLARNGNLLLALIIFVFSFAFPIVKLVSLWVIWLRPLAPQTRGRVLHRLKALGKWSMLDVFVVGIFIGSVRFGFLAQAYPRVGLYLFFAAVILSMVATILEFRASRAEEGPDASGKEVPSLMALPVATLAMLFLSAGVSLPLMETRKWVFWKTEYSVLTGTARMFRDGNYLLSGIIAVFVIVVPALALAGQMVLVFLRRSGRHSGRLAAFLALLDKWTMVDVFALGLLIVLVKVGALADAVPKAGLSCFIAGVFLSTGTSWLMRN